MLVPIEDLYGVATQNSCICTENNGQARAFLERKKLGVCPYLLVEILKLFENREVSFAFFKLVFCDASEFIVQSCCIVAHVLAAEGLRLMAQDVLSCVSSRIGECRSNELVEFMWREHSKYESDFSILDSLMRAFVNADMGSQALKIWDRMREVRIRPSLSAVSIFFALLIRVGDYGSVWKLFRDMIQRGPCPNIFVYNVMILGFCRKGCVRTGESLLFLMRKYGCEPDVIAHNLLISAYCVRGWTSHALNWAHFMAESGCEPSTATFVTIINALCKEGNIVEARKIFEEMQEMGVSPGTVTYNALMDGHVKAREIGNYKYGREDDGNRFLRELSMMALIPDCSISDMSISGLCWAGRLDEALHLLKTMLEKGIPVSIIAINSLICAYSRAGLHEKAFEVYNIMTKFGLTPSASTSTSLLIGLTKVGKLQIGLDIFTGKMHQNGRT
nr:pentatricopeptide repeat-containing protein At1g09900-like [Coffea arabica]